MLIHSKIVDPGYQSLPTVGSFHVSVRIIGNNWSFVTSRSILSHVLYLNSGLSRLSVRQFQVVTNHHPSPIPSCCWVIILLWMNLTKDPNEWLVVIRNTRRWRRRRKTYDRMRISLFPSGWHDIIRCTPTASVFSSFREISNSWIMMPLMMILINILQQSAARITKILFKNRFVIPSHLPEFGINQWRYVYHLPHSLPPYAVIYSITSAWLTPSSKLTLIIESAEEIRIIISFHFFSIITSQSSSVSGSFSPLDDHRPPCTPYTSLHPPPLPSIWSTIRLLFSGKIHGKSLASKNTAVINSLNK